MRDALKLNAPRLDTAPLAALGAKLGSAEMQTHARLANIHTPELRSHDRFGRRIDQVEFHPSYHALMAAATGAGMHGTPWSNPVDSPHVLRAASFMLFTELEPSILCPISMTYAVTPALRPNAAVYADWGPRLASRAYDPALKPWRDKAGLTMGMGMTEKQGGSDVRANTTEAEPDGQDDWGQRYRVTGHKWFLSAPMCDAFLVLAQSTGGLSCFFLPRVLPDGSLQCHVHPAPEGQAGQQGQRQFRSRIPRRHGLAGRRGGARRAADPRDGHDDPHGLRAGHQRPDAPGPVDRAGPHGAARGLRQAPDRPAPDAQRAGRPGAGIGSRHRAGLARGPRLRQARRCARSRDGAPAHADRASSGSASAAAHFAQEAMECLGGNGYVEEGGEGIMARIYREMPVNSIWEGAGNIMALDLLRALRKADAGAALAHELAPAKGAHPALDRLAAALPARVEQMATEVEARRLAQDVALAVQAALLYQTAPASVFARLLRLAPGRQLGPRLRHAGQRDRLRRHHRPRHAALSGPPPEGTTPCPT